MASRYKHPEIHWYCLETVTAPFLKVKPKKQIPFPRPQFYRFPPDDYEHPGRIPVFEDQYRTIRIPTGINDGYTIEMEFTHTAVMEECSIFTTDLIYRSLLKIYG